MYTITKKINRTNKTIDILIIKIVLLSSFVCTFEIVAIASRNSSNSFVMILLVLDRAKMAYIPSSYPSFISSLSELLISLYPMIRLLICFIVRTVSGLLEKKLSFCNNSRVDIIF